jgi:hypothetical protein
MQPVWLIVSILSDGFTDLPLLDWAAVPVLLDRTGEKCAKYRGKGYHHAASICEAVDIIKKKALSGGI